MGDVIPLVPRRRVESAEIAPAELELPGAGTEGEASMQCQHMCGSQVVRFPTHRRLGVPEPFVTKPQVAAHLGVSTRWVEGQMQHGLPHTKDPCSRLVRFRLGEVEEWVLGRCEGS